MAQHSAHPMFTHPDGTVCIWLENEWFVPLDAGGEGYTCQKEHPGDELNRKLADALAFYADPETYHAFWFRWESPAGAFVEDFSDDHGDEFYDREMPGKHARAALKEAGWHLGRLSG